MTKLMKELQRVFDMKEPWDEAKKKLHETWVIVNGEPVKILEFYGTDSSIVDAKQTNGEIKAISVETLELFLPESGIYSDGKVGLLVVKLPKRQWQKSFSDLFYKVRTVTKEAALIPKNYLDIIYKGKRQDIFVDGKKNIWFWENLVGKIDKGNIVCLDMNFEQELRDWSRDNACSPAT